MGFHFQIFLVALCLSQSGSDWCYTDPSCAPSSWTSEKFCNGSRQSPVDIPESSAHYNGSLGPFQFTDYSAPTKLQSISNIGHTVEVAVGDGVSMSGGGLSSPYTARAFHFHWDNGSAGSEHRLTGRQFPMEMHIVHTKDGMNLTDARKVTDGIAVLGFFIDISDSVNASQMTSLAKLLPQVSVPGTKLSLNSSFSLDGLLAGVDRTAYYRYLGSLTTPTCDEAVVWTVFRNPIYVPRIVVQTFTTSLNYNESGNLEPMVNNFRPPQPLNGRQVQMSFNMSSFANSTAAPSTRNTTSTGNTAQSSGILCMSLLLLYRGMASNVIC
ncbi:carbonic anhydrase 4-like isoform X2 [Rana temporaria]|uniref:carbonic anhydrase 4-like isoform X2 n=1 Tax=Rana temporaria TaxID=8407 RepID=UPI001AAD9E4E|nr:carbonic anhydrase 4-like isoform X2 [Rana temporaria]